MSKEAKETNGANTNSNAGANAGINLTVLPRSQDYQAIKATVTANDVSFATIKKSVEAGFTIGKDSAIAAMLAEPVNVTVTRIENGERSTKAGTVPLAMVLAFASNGMFEQFNTNLKNGKDFDDQWNAVQAGYIYKSDHALSLKEPEKDNSFRAFLQSVIDGKTALPDEQSSKIVSNVIAKGLKLGKGVTPTTEQAAIAAADAKVMSFGITQLAKLEIQLFKFWPWLEQAVSDSGYARTELAADELL